VPVADRPELIQYASELWAARVADCGEGCPHSILIAASRTDRDYSLRVAVKLNASLLEDDREVMTRTKTGHQVIASLGSDQQRAS
jgi:electron transfer flavoprotein alpha subunit